jgi:hypothetical protein
MTMGRLQQLTGYIRTVASDVRLKPVHISLYTALCHVWIENHYVTPCHVSRKNLMLSSKIKAKATYHQAIRDLQRYGYISYSPTYHPRAASSVCLLALEHTTNQ